MSEAVSGTSGGEINFDDLRFPAEKKLVTKETLVSQCRPSRDRRVKLADGYSVTMRPLPPDKITALTAFFKAVEDLQKKNVNPIEIFSSAKEQIVSMLRECMPEEPVTTTIDLADIPFLMSVFFEQNWNVATIDAWNKLSKQMDGLAPLVAAQGS